MGCAPSTSTDTLPTEGQLKALTYNVHGLPPEITGDDTAERMTLIAPHLNNFDVVGLQEDFDDDNHATLEDASSHLTKIRFSELYAPDRFYGPGLAVFADYEAQAPVHEHFETCHGTLDSSSDCLASKGFQAVRLQLGPSDAHTVDVYNTHLEAGGGDGDNEARAAQIDQLIAAMNSVSEGRAVLFLGDTNLHDADPDDRPEMVRFLEDAGLTELCVAVNCAEPGRIDRIVYRSSEHLTLTGLDWWVDQAFFDSDGVPLSDHDAIAGSIQWEAHD